ncbi:MAG: response regulator [Chloroflexi bacterium]|nr:response regulator [Chloroflexota bacterium]
MTQLGSDDLTAGESGRRLALMFSTMFDILYVLDVEPDDCYRFALVNENFYAATGLNPEQVIAQRVEDVLPPTAHPLVLGKYREAIENRQLIRWDEESVFPAGRRFGEVTVTPYFDARGVCTQLFGAVRDVTARKEAEQALQRSQEQLTQAQRLESIGLLAGGVAHDFNNLLTAIMGFSDLISEDLPPDSHSRPYLNEIRAAGERAATLTRQLLAFSRRQPLQPTVLDLNSVVTNIERLIKRVIGEHIDFATVLDHNLSLVEADPGQIEQVILNLVINARDAMTKGGKLTIETANAELDESYVSQHVGVTVGPYVMLVVSDTGTGMDKETQARIFEPFFTTKEPGRGTGLGLSTVYGIVKQSGGNIWVYSEPMQGTTFRIYLPRVDQAAAPSAPSTPAALPRGHETVLIAEDEASVRALAEILLQTAGYTVLAAENGLAALELAGHQAGPIHLLLTDLVMPGMGGTELAERLAQLHPETRVVFMSGFSPDVEIGQRALPSGMAFLPKPFTFSALASKVREVLDKAPAR